MDCKVSSTEKERIYRLLKAASNGSWDDFRHLTDAPFPNYDSMKSQFDDSSERIRRSAGNFDIDCGVDILEDGARFIIVKIFKKPDIDIVLSMRSTSSSSESKIEIWTFAQQIDWDN